MTKRVYKPIKPTFTGKITLKKMDSYYDYHRANFIVPPAIWYFTPLQITQLDEIFSGFPVWGRQTSLPKGGYRYKDVDIYIVNN